MFNPAIYCLRWVSQQLATYGIIDDCRGERIAELAWPRFLTMFSRSSLRVVDLSMVGLSIGSGAIAGLAFATIYWKVAVSFGLGIAGGTIGFVSQRFGAGQLMKAGTAIKQSVWVGLLFTIPFVVAYWMIPQNLVGLLTGDRLAIQYGSTYLRTMSIGLLFVMFNLISSRALAGADNTWIPMVIRSSGAVINIGLNAILIFGLDFGVIGAAVGTVIAEGLVSGCFLWGLIFGSVPGVGDFPIGLRLAPPYFDWPLIWRLIRTASPLIVQKLGKVVVRFPLFVLLGVFGPAVVSAFEIGRRVRNLLNAFGAGFSMSASSVVGQELGRHDERTAMRYAHDTVALSGVVFVLSGLLTFFCAPFISRFFVSDPQIIARTTPFIRAATVSFVGLGLFRTFGGVLKAAGDNSWIMYGRLVGLYLSLLPITYLGTISSLGVTAIYLAIISETWIAAAITGYRALSGEWIRSSRSQQSASSTE